MVAPPSDEEPPRVAVPTSSSSRVSPEPEIVIESPSSNPSFSAVAESIATSPSASGLRPSS